MVKWIPNGMADKDCLGSPLSRAALPLNSQNTTPTRNPNPDRNLHRLQGHRGEEEDYDYD
jgi:hypothetical protein